MVLCVVVVFYIKGFVLKVIFEEVDLVMFKVNGIWMMDILYKICEFGKVYFYGILYVFLCYLWWFV